MAKNKKSKKTPAASQGSQAGDDTAKASSSRAPQQQNAAVSYTEVGRAKNRRATKFYDTLRLADDIKTVSDRLFLAFPGSGDMDEDAAAACFHKTVELITGAQAGTIETGKTVKELLELTVGFAATASEEKNVGYAYGEQATVKKTDTSALIVGVLAIVAPWVLKALGFPDEKSDTVPGKYHDGPFTNTLRMY